MDEDDAQQFSLRWHNHQVDTLRTVLSEATLFLIPHWTPYKWNFKRSLKVKTFFSKFHSIFESASPSWQLHDSKAWVREERHYILNSVVGALGRMLATGALSDVTLSASGGTLKAHRIVLAACSQYFAKLFKEVEGEGSALVVVVGCSAAELQLLLSFMYTGEVTAGRRALPALLRLARTLQVSGLSDADANPHITQPIPEVPTEPISPINLEQPDASTDFTKNDSNSELCKQPELCTEVQKEPDYLNDNVDRNDNEKDKLSKLDQIVQNLYSTHRIGNYATAVTPPITNLVGQDPRRSSTCVICNKRLSNQYNLRVHMDTHAGRRHACCACSHVSRSRDALRKHVAYRHGRGACD